MKIIDQDFTSKKFGWYVVLGEANGKFQTNKIGNKNFIPTWFCLCACGNVKELGHYSIHYNKDLSCGCYRSIWTTETNLTHGKSRTPEHKIWLGIRKRCYNKTSTRFKYYGGRGIEMSDAWKNSFEQFLNDMGRRPSEKHSVDRIDNNGNYCKSNCRWATWKQQANNKRNNKKQKGLT